MKKRRKATSRTPDEQRRYDDLTRALERRLDRGFAELDRRAGRPVRTWRESADERIAEVYRDLDRRSSSGP